MSEDKYWGSAKEHVFENGDYIMKQSFSRNDLLDMADNCNEAGWLNLVVSRRREVGQYGHTHSIKKDTWKPKPRDNGPVDSFSAPQQGGFTPPPMPDLNTPISEDDIPF